MESNDRKPEEMAEFFDKRADIYEAHMAENPKAAYWEELVAQQFPETDQQTTILDLGCGTGREIRSILCRQPNASITCMDIAPEMLKILKLNYQDHKSNLTILEKSYFDYQYPAACFDYVVACATMHHGLFDQKCDLYSRICSSLISNGLFIINDYFVTKDEEETKQREYFDLIGKWGIDQNKFYHIDIPFSVKSETRVLVEAGFTEVKIIDEYYSSEWSSALLVAGK